ncbi:DUF3953 domain-containing protein [Halobacillus massiliensis]|uniref:DUF3953 domain-containing protein n=1 Tax=Halobacillus massiliensis TaxID=1926286 RepID=UPI0009E506D4|nr:DUF3953 domain-containing protein [Halobacillus massiliensis]
MLKKLRIILSIITVSLAVLSLLFDSTYFLHAALLSVGLLVLMTGIYQLRRQKIGYAAISFGSAGFVFAVMATIYTM